MKMSLFVAAIALAFAPALALSAAETSATAPLPLTPKSLEPLVAGVAFYPDPVVELILDAAQHPAELHAAASGEQGTFPTSVQQLQESPALLKQLDQHMALTTRLGVAARTQLADVWAAIDHVRAQFEAVEAQQAAAQAETTAAASSGGTAAPAAVYGPPYGAFVAGLVADNVVDQFRDAYYGTNNVPAISVSREAAAASAARTDHQDFHVTAFADEIQTGNRALSESWDSLSGKLNGSFSRSSSQNLLKINPGFSRPSGVAMPTLQKTGANRSPASAGPSRSFSPGSGKSFGGRRR